jgi:hypothetical protein
MILLETALRVVEINSGAKVEDKVEAYQFLCDNWYLDRLNPQQQAEYNQFFQIGLIKTAIWRDE